MTPPLTQETRIAIAVDDVAIMMTWQTLQYGETAGASGQG
eukprot:CAMPEP_0197578908 /NCGR_PEP_ID=MMETSP1326-20131121/3006_1 /TAXON_ID=1155430 /ORGANISM="Genus nov. species nov., Strain RCC2288" /LENGTH=39 /DNA_ID= /DNA_START= /DNA_END= /DNA_ORIENTATION=